MTQTLTTERLDEIAKLAVRLFQISGCAAVTSSGETVMHHTLVDEILSALHDVTVELLANREAQPVTEPYMYELWKWDETVPDLDRWFLVERSREKLVAGKQQKVVCLYTAPPAPAVPDDYCIMPLTLTAANGAKGALSGEFKVSRTVRCHECGGEGCDDCADAGEFEEEITIPWDTIKEIYRAAVDACRAAMLAAAPEGGNGA